MNKDKEKDTKKLNAEELEKRVAPLALTYSDPTDPAGSPAPTEKTTSKGPSGGIGHGKPQQV